MKKYLFGTLICLMLSCACAWPLPACAQSGSSTCQVTATAGETAPPSEPGDGGEPEKPDPGDGQEEPDPGSEPTGEPDSGSEPTKEPDSGNEPTGEPKPGDGGGSEPGAPGTTPAPGDKEPGAGGKPGTGDGQGKNPPETGQGTTPAESAEPSGEGMDPAQQPEEPSRTGEPQQEGPDGKTEGHGRLPWWLAAILALCALAVLAASGVFRSCWAWLMFVSFRKSRRRFHGILTEEKNSFIRVRNADGSSRLIQEIIDSTGSLAEYRAELKKEAAVTEIPRQSRMRVSFTGRDGVRRCRETAADEQGMLRILEKLNGAGGVEVRIICRGAGIDIPLLFHV